MTPVTPARPRRDHERPRPRLRDDRRARRGERPAPDVRGPQCPRLRVHRGARLQDDLVDGRRHRHPRLLPARRPGVGDPRGRQARDREDGAARRAVSVPDLRPRPDRRRLRDGVARPDLDPDRRRPREPVVPRPPRDRPPVVLRDRRQRPGDASRSPTRPLTDFLARNVLGQRRASRCSTARLDLSIYKYSSACYYEVVYIQGGNFLDDLRKRMGNTRVLARPARLRRREPLQAGADEDAPRHARRPHVAQPRAALRPRFPRLYYAARVRYRTPLELTPLDPSSDSGLRIRSIGGRQGFARRSKSDDLDARPRTRRSAARACGICRNDAGSSGRHARQAVTSQPETARSSGPSGGRSRRGRTPAATRSPATASTRRPAAAPSRTPA